MSTNDKNVQIKKPRSKWGTPNVKISDDISSGSEPIPSKRKSFKPKQEPLKSAEPFDGQTGNKRDYVEHPIEPRKPKPKNGYKPPSDKFEGSSTARNDFSGEMVPKRASFKPENKPSISNEPFDGTSTANQDFKEHPVEKKVPRKPAEYTKPEGDVDHNTINKDTYKEHPVQRQVVKKPESAKAMKGEGPMEKQTNFMKDYPGWEASRPQKARKQEYVPPQEKMDGNTSSKLDYPTHKGQKRESFKPKANAMKSDDPFDRYTGYNDTYKEHPVQPKHQRKRDEYQPPTESMTTSTSNKNDFPEHKAQKRHGFKPNGDALKSDDPFDGYTGYKDTYKEHPIQPKQQRKQDGYQPPTESMDMSTSNNNDYPEHQAQKRKGFKPKGDALKSDDPFDGYTGYKDTYKEHPIQPKQQRKQDGYQPPTESMVTSTSNKNDYPEHQAQKRKGFKPNGDALKSGDPFDGYTGYKDTYKEHPIQPKQQRKQDGYQPPTESMVTSTSNKNDYPEHQAQKRQGFKPNGDALKSDDPFDGYTGYKDTYKEHPIQPKQQRKKDGYQPPTESMDTSTSNKNDYPEHQAQKRKGFKPNGDALKSDDPFDGYTGYNDTYKEHPIQPKQQRKQDGYQPPTESMDMSTSNNNDYPEHQAQKRQGFKPKGDALKSDDPFDGYTGYKDTYKEHPIQPKQQRKKDGYQPPTESMATSTSNKNDYPEHQAQKRQGFKPSGDALKSDDPFDGYTGYKDTYKEHPIQQKQQRKKDGYQPPTESMATSTSNKNDYPEHQAQKRKGFKPNGDALKSDDPFDGYTGYKDTYKEHPIQPKQQRKQDGYQPPTESMATSTSNKNDYPEHQAQKRQSFKPNGDALKSDDPFDGYTGYKDTYKEHPIQQKQQRKRDGYQPPTESMATSTSNKNDYPEHQAQKRKGFKPNGDALKSNDPFDGYTGYKDTYKEHPIQPKEQRKKDGYQPPTESMATSTSNKNDYPEHQAQKRQGFKPNGDALKSDDPFDGYTGYKDTYKEHPIQPKQHRKRDEFQPPTESMATSTSNKNDYPEHQAQKRQSFKPNGDTLKSDDPFDDYTGYKDTYREHPIQPKQQRKRDGYQPPTESMATSTSNKNDYPEHQAQKRQSFKPNGDALKSDDPFDDYTGYKDTYREHPIQPKQQRKQDGYQAPTESMATSTSNKNDYPEHQAQKRQSFKPNGNALKSDDPFDDYTGYKDTYREHPIQPKQQRKRDGYQPPTESMATSTSNKNDYPEHQAQKRQSFKPNGDALKSDDPFDDYTGYKDTYREHPIQPKQQRKQDTYQPPTESMATSTSNKNDYPEHQAQKRKGFKPNGDALKSDDPFDDYTGYKDTYREHPIQPKQQRRPDGYQPPTESMATSTSNKNDYPEHQAQKRQSFKPNGDALKSDDPFDDYTGYKDTYREHPIQPKQQRKQDGYQPPTESMATSTSNKNDYPEHQAQKRQSFKPNGDALKSDDPFDDYTGYKDTYREHPIQPKQQRKQDGYQAPTESMATSTSNKNDYPEHQAQKRQSFKPNGNALKSDDPFDDYTGYKDTYREHPIQPKQQRKRDGYQPPTESMATSTSNKNDYPEHQAQKRQSFKPNGDALKSDDPFDDYTGYKDTYREHPIQPKQQRKQDTYQPPTESMATSTSNKNDYPEHQAQKRKGFKPNGDALKSDDPFDDYTGYKDTYREHPIQPKQQRRPDGYQPPTESMATSTSNKNDYPEHQAQKRQSFKPNGDALKSDDPFDDYTGYKDTYREHPIQPKQQRKKDGYQPPTESMATSTSNKNDYPEHQAQKRQSFKPNGDALKSDDPFDDYTGYKDTYREHPIQPKQQRKKDGYQPPTESMATSTSNKNDYPEHQAQKRQSFKPNGDALKSDDPFDDYTGYKDTYREHPIQPKQQRKKDGYQPPTESMATSTSNKNDYPEHQAQKRQSFKPNGDALKSDDPFDDYTGYKDTYREHPIQPKLQRKQDTYQPPTESMATSTSNKNDYPEHQAQKRKGFKPNGDALKSDDPFDDYTGYKDTYREHPMQPKQQRKQDGYQPPTESMATSTSNKNDYPEHQAQKRQSFKPNGDALKSDDPFDDYTGYKDTYREHPIQPKQQWKRDEYQPPTESMQTSTTNRDAYHENPLSKRQSCKRDTEPFASNAPFDGSTTFSKDFQQWESDRPTVIRHQENLKLEGEMDLNTINKQAFKGDLVSRPTIKKQGSSHALTGDGTFYGDSAYGSSYKQHDAVPRLKPTKDAYVPPQGKFYAETTNHADFLEQPYSKRSKYIPPESTLKSHDPFAPTTGYQETFIEHQAAARVQREKAKYNPPTVPLETETTSHGAFKDVTTPKRSAYGPSKQAFRSVEPFSGSTTAKDDFKEFEVKKQHFQRQDTYVKSSEPMDLQTTSKASFKGDYIPRRSITRPRSSNTLKYDGKFTTETSYRGCFTQRDLPEKTFIKKATYEPPSVKFDGQTTNRADFVANQPTAKTMSYKATDSWLRSSAPMIMSSSYKDSFTEVKPTTRSRREPEPYVPSSVKFEGISTFNSDFLGREGRKRDSYRPSKVAFQSNVPFDGTTTASSDFKGSWETSRPQRVRPNMESFMQIDAKMNSNSTYRGDFESSKTVSWKSPPTLLGMA